VGRGDDGGNAKNTTASGGRPRKAVVFFVIFRNDGRRANDAFGPDRPVMLSS